MPIQHEHFPSLTGMDAVQPCNPNVELAVEDTERTPLPASTLVPEDSRPGVAEPMNDHDQALQNELVLLLSILEHHHSCMEAALHNRETLEILDRSRAIIDEVVGLADRLGTGGESDVLTSALADAGQLYTTFDRLRADLEPSLWQSVLFLFGRPRSSPAQQLEDFRHALADMYRVVETFLGLFRAQFQGEAGALEWEQASRLFLRDLRAVVDRVNA
jgi:hypothetical protein